MAKGRPKDPTRARRRTGHRRKPDEAPALAAVPALPAIMAEPLPAPDHLPEAMVPTWERLVELIGELGVRDVDAFALEALVRQYHRMRDTGKLVDDYGVVARNGQGEVIPSPFLRAEREATRAFVQLAEQYGLTLAARMRLGLMQLAGKTLAQALHEDLTQP